MEPESMQDPDQADVVQICETYGNLCVERLVDYMYDVTTPCTQECLDECERPVYTIKIGNSAKRSL